MMSLFVGFGISICGFDRTGGFSGARFFALLSSANVEVLGLAMDCVGKWCRRFKLYIALLDAMS